MMSFKKMVKGGLAALMALSLAACEASEGSGKSTSTETTSDYVASGDLKSYTIGTLGPTTGDYAVYGLAVTNAVKLAVEDYNAANGTKIKVDVQDSQGDQTQALNIYNKFVSDTKVAGIIGGTVSGESYAIAVQSKDTGVPIITPSGTAANITDEGGPNVFRACYTDPQQAKQVADFTYETLGLKKAAMIYNYYEKDVQIAKQARNLGIKAQIVGADGWDGAVSVAGNDASAIEGVIFINQYSPDMESVQDIMKKYKEKFGTDINSFGINAYDSTMLLLQTIEKVGSLKASDIVKGIASTDYKGILGSISFDSNGDPIKEPVFVQIKNGQYTTYKK